MEGFVEPLKGVNRAYDAANEAVINAKRALNDYLTQIKSSCTGEVRSIQYKDIGSEKYQIEIHNNVKVPPALMKQMEIASKSSSVKRYYTEDSRELIANLQKTEFEKEQLLKDSTRLIFQHFGSQIILWHQTTKCLAELDCYCALATLSDAFATTCVPEFISHEDNNGEPLFALRDAVHPVLAASTSINQFIPNDTVLGTEENLAKFVLVSGANMGKLIKALIVYILIYMYIIHDY